MATIRSLRLFNWQANASGEREREKEREITWEWRSELSESEAQDQLTYSVHWIKPFLFLSLCSRWALIHFHWLLQAVARIANCMTQQSSCGSVAATRAAVKTQANFFSVARAILSRAREKECVTVNPLTDQDWMSVYRRTGNFSFLSVQGASNKKDKWLKGPSRNQ